MQPEIAQSLFTMLLNTSFALVMGGLTSSFLLANERSQQGLILGRLARVTRLGLALGIVSTLLSLWQMSASMSEVPLWESGPTIWRMFAGTHYGRIGLLSVALLIVAAMASVFFIKDQRARTPAIICLIAMAFYALSRVAVGHAYEFGLVSFAVVIEWLHLILMSVWVGLVVTAGWIVLPHMCTSKFLCADITAYLSSLSTWATYVLVGILVTGGFNTYRVLTVPQDFVATQYGWTLVVKLVFVALAVALGGWNRFYGFPKASLPSTMRGSESASIGQAMWILRVESVALLIVLAAAAVLTGSAPPASM